MDIIQNNPYRILGVYSNSSTKERIANKGKMSAFLKVGKQVMFPLDLTTILPSINRTVDAVAHADAELTLPADQVRYAQFWWMNVTPLDGIAFNHLLNGDADMAKSIWMKKDDVSSLQNRVVLSIINDDWESAINHAESLYSHYTNDFINKIIGDSISISTPLWQVFIDELIVSGKNALSLLDIVSISDWKIYIAEKSITPLIDNITQHINLAKATRGKGPTARLEAGNKLMTSTKSGLNQLRQCLPSSDLRYQSIVDKLATEILQCGIDYFNETDDDDAPQNATILQNYALSIAVGKLVKNRCKENVDILKKVGIEYCVRRELNQLNVLIKILRHEEDSSRFSLFSRCISDVSKIVNQSLPLLDRIKNKLDGTSYLNISSAVASSAINALVEIINLQQRLLAGDTNRLKVVILEAVSLMTTIGRLDMDSNTRNYFAGNKSTLESISNKLNPSGACYIATMVYGDYNHPQVMVLRKFRDDYLSARCWGRHFIKIYYKYSPRLVEKLSGHDRVNNIIKKILDIFVELLKRNQK